MGKNAYMVLGYACNQKCACCPCQKDLNIKQKIDIEELKTQINVMKSMGVTDVTISGGEPTIYPEFFEIIEYIINSNIKAHILSNGEKFSNIDFANQFINIAKDKGTTVTTTFHSYKKEEHESQNKSNGSFERSLEGLKYLDNNGILISIKHCITKYNYKDIKNFIKFVVDNFSSNVEIQIWGIDLCGIDKYIADNYFENFKNIKTYIEDALNYFEMINRNNRKQIITLNNLPLCMCDCYYWNYFTLEDAHYIDYTKNNKHEFEKNYGPVSSICKACAFKKFCKGTYKTVFETYGDNIVELPKEEILISKYKNKYVIYNQSNINKLYFSIYNEIQLTPKGLTIYNKKTNVDVNIRLKARQILELMKSLNNGIEKNKLINLFNNFNMKLKSEEIINDWIIKGIIE